jgi:nucleoside-diphosphate-sugar epimerase
MLRRALSAPTHRRPRCGFTGVADTVAATIAAMERGPAGAVYSVGGRSEATMQEAIALAELVSGP